MLNENHEENKKKNIMYIAINIMFEFSVVGKGNNIVNHLNFRTNLILLANLN